MWDSSTSRAIALYLIKRYEIFLYQPSNDYTASQLFEVAIASNKLKPMGYKIATILMIHVK